VYIPPFLFFAAAGFAAIVFWEGFMMLVSVLTVDSLFNLYNKVHKENRYHFFIFSINRNK
jgi:hypothetical protein